MKAQSAPLQTWTETDVREGRCAPLDIGRPKPAEQTAESFTEVLESLPPATMYEFKQAVLRVARDQHGSYDAFLRAYPHFHQKFLLAMAREATPPPAGPKVLEVEWLSPERHAYKYANPSHPLHYIYQRNRTNQIADATIIDLRH